MSENAANSGPDEQPARFGPMPRDLHETVSDGSRARAPARRGKGGAGARAARR